MKSDPARDLVIAVARVARHEPFVTTTPSEVILSGFAHVEHSTVRADEYSGPLTLREQEVVQLLAEGKSNKEVANILSISVKTVETHRAASMRKLGLTSVVELVHYAVRNDMIAL